MDGVAAVYEKSTSKEATVLAALMELAKIYRDLGQSEKGFKTLERCLEIARERVKIKQGSDPSRQNLANVYRELALRSEEFRRDMKAALRYNEESLAIWDDVYQKPKDDGFALRKTIVRYFLAEAYTRVGVGRYRIGEVARRPRGFPEGLQPAGRTRRRDERRPADEAGPELLDHGAGRDLVPARRQDPGR